MSLDTDRRNYRVKKVALAHKLMTSTIPFLNAFPRTGKPPSFSRVLESPVTVFWSSQKASLMALVVAIPGIFVLEFWMTSPF